MNRSKYYLFTIYLFILVAFTGCSCKAGIKAVSQNAAELSCDVQLGTLIGDTIVSLTDLASENSTSIFDEESMQESMKLNGFTDTKIKSIGDYGVNILTNADKNTLSPIVDITNESLTVTLTPQNINSIVLSLGDDYISYASLLMAPVFTGESMSVDEYTELLGGVYGNEIAQEVIKGHINLTLTGLKGKTKQYDIKLVDLLTLSDKAVYSVSNL